MDNDLPEGFRWVQCEKCKVEWKCEGVSWPKRNPILPGAIYEGYIYPKYCIRCIDQLKRDFTRTFRRR